MWQINILLLFLFSVVDQNVFVVNQENSVVNQNFSVVDHCFYTW